VTVCGTDYGAAAADCGRSVRCGTDGDCSAGESCFAGVPCPAQDIEEEAAGAAAAAAVALPALVPVTVCGADYGDASLNCGTNALCLSDGDCAAGEVCYAGVPCVESDLPRAEGAGAGADDEAVVLVLLTVCGPDYGDASLNCGTNARCATDGDCAAGEVCYAGVPCAAGDIQEELAGGGSGPAATVQLTVCGADYGEAAADCGRNLRCATDLDCPVGQTCFSGVPCAAADVLEAPAGTGGDGPANPNRYFCGTSQEEAAELCRPCPGGTREECGDDLALGCFFDVAACAGGHSVPVPQPNEPAPSPSAAAAAGNPAPTPRWTNMPFAPSPSSAPKTVIGYYASWQWYDRDKKADPNNIDFTKYDRINYAFFQPDPSGNLYGTDEWGDPQLLWGPYDWSGAGPTFCSWDAPGPGGRNCNQHDTSRGMLALAHAVGTEVWPSIGGWTLSDNFPGIAATSSGRERFAQQCVELIKAYRFDGIDIVGLIVVCLFFLS